MNTWQKQIIIKSYSPLIFRTFLEITIGIFATLLIFPFGFAESSLNQEFSYNKSEIIGNYFFPQEKAKWDGYEVLNRDWRLLDDYQKYKFVSEAIDEIENKEGVKVIFDGPKSQLVNTLDNLLHIFNFSNKNQPAITILLKFLCKTGSIEGEITTFVPNHPFLARKISTEINKEIPFIELNKYYIGYIFCYKNSGKWMPGSEGPVIGEVKKRFFFAECIIVPCGATVLAVNYPLNYEYKTIAFREINSFIDDSELENICYKVIIEPVNKAW